MPSLTSPDLHKLRRLRPHPSLSPFPLGTTPHAKLCFLWLPHHTKRPTFFVSADSLPLQVKLRLAWSYSCCHPWKQSANCIWAFDGDMPQHKQANKQANKQGNQQASTHARKQASKRANQQTNKRTNKQASKQESINTSVNATANVCVCVYKDCIHGIQRLHWMLFRKPKPSLSHLIYCSC